MFYYDDHGTIQGPYTASTVLYWYEGGFFGESHLMRITDNGQLSGNKITIVKTLGELKKMFGNETPIPRTAEVVAKSNCPSFSLNTVPRHGNLMKLIKVKEEVLEVEDQTPSTSAWKSPDRVEPLLTGPTFPPVKNEKKRKRSRSPSRSQSPHVKNHKETSRERLGSPNYPQSSNTQSASTSKKKTTNWKEPCQKISADRKNLPFYHGDKAKEYDRLRKNSVFELAKYLRSDYETMEKSVRNELFKNVAVWDMPERCKICDCPLKLPANYLSHVLSENHIRKSIEKKHGGRKCRFTLETDYLPLKREIEVAKTIQVEPRKPMSNFAGPQLPGAPNPSSKVNLQVHSSQRRQH